MASYPYAESHLRVPYYLSDCVHLSNTKVVCKALSTTAYNKLSSTVYGPLSMTIYPPSRLPPSETIW